MQATAELQDADEWLGVESMLSVPGSDGPHPVAERALAPGASLERALPRVGEERDVPRARS